MSKLNISETVINYEKQPDFSPSGSLTPKNNKSKQSFSVRETKEAGMEETVNIGYLYTYSNECLITSQSRAEVQHYSIDPAKVKESVEEFNNNEANFHEKAVILAGNSKKSGPTSGAYQSGDGKKTLHPYENLLIKQASSTLTGDTKVVLIDIFAREDSGKVKFQTDGNPETHTIILCKGKKAQTEVDAILVIDPNNSAFSSHLFTQYSDSNPKLEIVGSNKKIYQPVSNIGKFINSSRDCIDIAIKLAYKLQGLESNNISFTSQGVEIFNEKEANEIVKSISNSSKFDNTIDKIISNTQGFLGVAARLKQVTQEGYGKEFYDNELKNLKIIKSKLADRSPFYSSTIKGADKVITGLSDIFTQKESVLYKDGLGVDEYIKVRNTAGGSVSLLDSLFLPKQNLQAQISLFEMLSNRMGMENIEFQAKDSPNIALHAQDIEFTVTLTGYTEYMEL